MAQSRRRIDHEGVRGPADAGAHHRSRAPFSGSRRPRSGLRLSRPPDEPASRSGGSRPRRRGPLDRLAHLLASIHDVSPTIEVRTYQSWAWEAKYTVPPWATDTGLWEEAFALLRTDPPDYEPCFIHRDFQPRNVLWSDDRVSGVVDWVETSMGPAWLDVAHCCTNIAIDHGSDTADRFAAAYVARTGREPQAYFDVMDIVGFLPPPGRSGFIKAEGERRRLEQRLSSVMQRVALHR